MSATAVFGGMLRNLTAAERAERAGDRLFPVTR